MRRALIVGYSAPYMPFSYGMRHETAFSVLPRASAISAGDLPSFPLGGGVVMGLGRCARPTRSGWGHAVIRLDGAPETTWEPYFCRISSIVDLPWLWNSAASAGLQYQADLFLLYRHPAALMASRLG